MRVLREDRVPPVVCVRVRHTLYPCPQELVPQQGSVRHSICREGGEESGDGNTAGGEIKLRILQKKGKENLMTMICKEYDQHQTKHKCLTFA